MAVHVKQLLVKGTLEAPATEEKTLPDAKTAIDQDLIDDLRAELRAEIKRQMRDMLHERRER